MPSAVKAAADKFDALLTTAFPSNSGIQTRFICWLMILILPMAHICVVYLQTYKTPAHGITMTREAREARRFRYTTRTRNGPTQVGTQIPIVVRIQRWWLVGSEGEQRF